MIPKKVRDAVKARASGRCEKCGIPYSDYAWPPFSMHHDPPKGMGGRKRADTPEDLKLLCHACHARFHGIIVVDNKMDGRD